MGGDTTCVSEDIGVRVLLYFLPHLYNLSSPISLSSIPFTTFSDFLEHMHVSVQSGSGAAAFSLFFLSCVANTYAWILDRQRLCIRV